MPVHRQLDIHDVCTLSPLLYGSISSHAPANHNDTTENPVLAPVRLYNCRDPRRYLYLRIPDLRLSIRSTPRSRAKTTKDDCHRARPDRRPPPAAKFTRRFEKGAIEKNGPSWLPSMVIFLFTSLWGRRVVWRLHFLSNLFWVCSGGGFQRSFRLVWATVSGHIYMVLRSR